ncbi:hypothetical protein MED297_20467 [Reinekea sp. MED297]|uniref:Uncharacterized protein n=2 Tax=Reinekea TaxID=230494 RepID=A4B9J8_9GAMM|nr:hypothetical protein MED297_20467 [Reinekea sp. MED297] [Reinekea blandensis MED297]
MTMSFVCIDLLSSLNRPIDKDGVTRADYEKWVDTYLKAHKNQSYKYRGKDVYAACCAYLHTYGSEANRHKKDQDTLMFGYHDGGKHMIDSTNEERLVLISMSSFVNDLVCAVAAFLETCQADRALRARVESRLSKVLSKVPVSQNKM